MGAIAIAAILGLTGCNEPRAASASGGTPAPELVATTLDGRVIRLADLRGKVVLLDFWLGGCGPCLAEMPDLDAFYRSERDKGLEILAINMGQSEDAVAKAARQMTVSFPVLADPLKITIARYKVEAAPTFFIIDAKGNLVERIDGPLDKKLLAEKIASRQ
ncbi:TlpA family protein disulfide reductase [Telmatospirillum siberiense]|uniref:TlpA family protein disulfide reductase n=1 Tax=Telmatospirillum siberiense TaxID=382514 RepID=A0A2N3PM37_9PROT|nr:TlpA family protein disulfide reductase [Telmatospirillum siberiense]